MTFAMVSCAQLAPATGGSYPGEPLASIHGQFQVAEGSTIEGPLSVALAWNTGLIGTPQRLLSQSIRYDAPNGPAIDYRFDIFARPDVDLLTATYTDAGLGGPPGKTAFGKLFVYRDGNANGQLDMIGPDNVLVDQIVGQSASGTLGKVGYFIVYTESLDELRQLSGGGDALGLNVGFNLVRTNGMTFEPVSLDTPVPIELAQNAALSVALCPAYPTGTCGLPVPREMSFLAKLTVSPTSSTAEVSLYDLRLPQTIDDADVFVNGQRLALDAGTYRHTSTTRFINEGATNVVLAQAPGAAPMVKTATMPGAFEVMRPQANAMVSAGKPVTVEWSVSSAATSYEVAWRDAAGKTLSFDTTSGATSLTIAAPAMTGPVTLAVTASNRPALSFSEATITSLNERVVTVTVVP